MIDILQVCDDLAAGGLERMVVNVANGLPRDRFRSHLCTTKSFGALAATLSPHVSTVCVERRATLDVEAALRLCRYVRDNNIQIVHVHGTSLFFVALATLLGRFTKTIWHDHFGRYAVEDRPVVFYGPAAQRMTGVIAVNGPLADWARSQLRVRPDRVWYLPNFVTEAPDDPVPTDLPGVAGSRIVCVANFRPEKDHDNLLAAMRQVLARVPEAHLILLGTEGDRAYNARIMALARVGALAGHVTWLGSRPDVAAVVKACDVAVLSSASEGLPMALLEYGRAARATVTTDTGQCPEVVDAGRVALLVPTRNSDALAAGLVSLLESPARRVALGSSFAARIEDAYSVKACLGKVVDVYETLLAPGASG